MYGLELLVSEHQNILLLTDHVNKMCCDIIDGKAIDAASFYEVIDFARNYADKHHHGKEEQILFRIMMENLGPVAEKLIRNGMLVEHDLGRFHMTELEKALIEYEAAKTTENKLGIIMHAAGYANLLKRHIEKEDGAVYTFAERSLSDELKKQVDEETQEFEKKAELIGLQQKYMDMLKSW